MHTGTKTVEISVSAAQSFGSALFYLIVEKGWENLTINPAIISAYLPNGDKRKENNVQGNV